jgi:hypothetical protein
MAKRYDFTTCEYYDEGFAYNEMTDEHDHYGECLHPDRQGDLCHEMLCPIREEILY